jgi:hypothetical protein
MDNNVKIIKNLHIEDLDLVQSYLDKNESLFLQYVLKFGTDQVSNRLMKAKVTKNYWQVQKAIEETTGQLNMFDMELPSGNGAGTKATAGS